MGNRPYRLQDNGNEERIKAQILAGLRQHLRDDAVTPSRNEKNPSLSG